MKKYLKTKKRALTRRAVMWLGQTCNQRCYFCYFVNKIMDPKHPEHAFMTIDKAKDMCKILHDFYGCTSIDIQGGEPTIYPQIFDLITYCNDIGLYPTLITNGLVLAKPGSLKKYKDAGIRDFLVSLHGIEEVHDEVVCKEGAYEKIISAIEGMRELEIPFRFNCTMSKPVIDVLPQIARKAIDYGAYAINFIAFNPFGDQEIGQRTGENTPRYSDLMVTLTKAMDMLEEAKIECNVRYLPLCLAEERHRKNFYNYQQLSYDTHEWDYAGWLWTMMKSQTMKEGALVPPFHIGARGSRFYRRDHIELRDDFEKRPISRRLKFAVHNILGNIDELIRGKDALYRKEARDRAVIDCKYCYHDVCNKCSLKNICDGFHGDYVGLFGTDEAKAITDIPPVDDPLFYIKDQEKIIEDEDKNWAM